VTPFLGLAILLSATSSPQEPSVDDFHCQTVNAVALESIVSAYNAYQKQSVEIVEAGTRADADWLKPRVDPHAKFMIIQGDVGIGPQSDGPAGAIELAALIKPKSYQYMTAGPGPFSLDPCGEITVEMLFAPSEATSADSSEVTRLTFKFRGGLLFEAMGSGTSIVRGNLRGGPPRH
jgi:hypothetical protein